jgi:hypothetical protein
MNPYWISYMILGLLSYIIHVYIIHVHEKHAFTVISGLEGYEILLVRTESSVITKEQFVLIFLVYACTCFHYYYAF